MTFMLLFKPILILFKKSTKKAIQYFYLKENKEEPLMKSSNEVKQRIPAWVEILA